MADAIGNLVRVYDRKGNLVALYDGPTPPSAGPLAVGVEYHRAWDMISSLWVQFVRGTDEDFGSVGCHGPCLMVRVDDKWRLASPGVGPPSGFVYFLDYAAQPNTGNTAFAGLYRQYTVPGVSTTVVALDLRPGVVPLAEHDGGIPRIAFGTDDRVSLTLGLDPVIEQYDFVSGALLGKIELDGVIPVASYADGNDMLHVLVRPLQKDPSPARVVTLNQAGAAVADHSFRKAPSPPNTAWPWDLAVNDGEVAFSTASSVFQVFRYDADGTLVTRLYGATLRDRWEPTVEPGAPRPGRAIALAVGDGEALLAVDGDGGQIVAFEPGGRTHVAMGGVGAIDVASDSQGATFAALADSTVVRFADPARRDGPFMWQVECECEPISRIAASAGRVFISEPSRTRITVLDAATGQTMGFMESREASYRWPTDLAAGHDGALFTTDQTMDRISRWDTLTEPTISWTTGVGLGPRRLAAAVRGQQTVLAAVTAEGALAMYDGRTGQILTQWEPRLPDGSSPYASDIALLNNGRLFLSDDRSGQVHVFEEAPGHRSTPTPAPSPAPVDPRTSCTVTGDKVAAPQTVLLGQLATVTLTLQAECPRAASYVGADAVLVLDHSRSMRSRKFLWASELTELLAQSLRGSGHRVGLVSFADAAQLQAPVGADSAELMGALAALSPEGHTNLGEGLQAAAVHLTERARPKALPLIIVLTDGRSNRGPDPLRAATEVRQMGVYIYAIGVGPDSDPGVLRAIASLAEDALLEPSSVEVLRLVDRINATVYDTLATRWQVVDEIAPDMELISSRPAAVRGGSRLVWSWPVLPPKGITVTFDVRPLQPGRLPTNRRAVAFYNDADNTRRQYTFPVPEILVVAATPTPSITPIATATERPTVSLRPLFFPLALKESCTPGTRRADIVLVVDASTSMMEEIRPGYSKRSAAIAAASLFFEHLSPGDQAAIVWFNETAELEQELTDEGALLRTALSRIVNRRYSRLDLGIRTGREELIGPRRNLHNRPVLILLTDGKANPVGPTVAVTEGEAAKSAGIAIFAIGLGAPAELDDWALRKIASRDAFYYQTADPNELARIYEEIASAIPCPRELYWGQR